MIRCDSTDTDVCVYALGRAWQVALDQARAVRMAATSGMPGAPPPYGAVVYAQEPNGGYYGPHPPPYGNTTLTWRAIHYYVRAYIPHNLCRTQVLQLFVCAIHYQFVKIVLCTCNP